MDETLIKRLESAVTRLESLSTGIHPFASASDGSDAASDPSVVAFGDLIDQYVGRLSKAAEIIGGQVLDVTNRVKEAFAVQKELLIKLKQTQVCCFIYHIVKKSIPILISCLIISVICLCCRFSRTKTKDPFLNRESMERMNERKNTLSNLCFSEWMYCVLVWVCL